MFAEKIPNPVFRLESHDCGNIARSIRLCGKKCLRSPLDIVKSINMHQILELDYTTKINWNTILYIDVTYQIINLLIIVLYTAIILQ
ncbi:hypothetical protein LBMAG33_1570 [Candidatus Levyibacteriota bacterium]|nr:hypothetical protein LBMAG33_1570 [Candidatus Levybacteria bacterium]